MIENGEFKVKQVQKINDQVAFVNITLDINDYSLEDYQEMFDVLLNDEIMYNCKYEDNVWHATDKLKDRLAHFNFENKKYSEEMKKFDRLQY